MILKPTSDNIVIKLEEQAAEKTTASGIVLVGGNTQEARQDQGTVVAVGTGRILNDGTRITPEMKEGNQVIFNKFAGTEIVAGEAKYLIVKENDILAIINE